MLFDASKPGLGAFVLGVAAMNLERDPAPGDDANQLMRDVRP